MEDPTVSGFESLNRRSVMKKAGLTGLFGLVGAGSAAAQSSPTESELPIQELAMEFAIHPDQPVIAFTSITEADGYQLYVANGVKSADEIANQIEQLTDTEYGVHGVSWESRGILQYSMDGSTYQQKVNASKHQISTHSSEVLVDEEPLPISDKGASNNRLTTHATGYKVVECTNIPRVQDWCVRIHAGDGPEPTPTCDNKNVPGSMTHHHIISIYRKGGDGKDGINLWTGTKNGCLWVGEEHYSQLCWKLCKDGSGFPGFSTFVDHWEKILAAAIAAAGLSIGSTVVQGLAYILAGLSVKPPQPLPV